MTEQSQQLINEIIQRLENVKGDNEFDTVATTLLAQINSMAGDRLDFRSILGRMFDALNTTEDGQPPENPYDTRWSSPAFLTMAPIARAQAELAVLVEVLRGQVFVATATRENLDALGRDYNFLRNQATQALRVGVTRNQQGEFADFPIGSRLRARGTELIFIIEQTEGGHVLFRSEAFGVAGNSFYGTLSPASNINDFGSAELTDSAGAHVPGQNRETDEQYRRRFLHFLRRKSFGGNVSQYLAEIQEIDGVGNVMVFPCWRGAWTVGVSIVDGQNNPVSDSFAEHVGNLIDPIARAGTGMGYAPVGHRVTVSTPEYMDVDISIPIVPAYGATEGQLYPIIRQITEDYIETRVRAVFDTWERTYFANEGIFNPVADLAQKIELFENDPRYAELMEIFEHYPHERVLQSHLFEVLIQPQFLGVEVLRHELVNSVDFENIHINGEMWLGGFPVKSNQDRQFLPRLGRLEIEVVG